MKFLFSGHLFRFCTDNLITIVSPYGDKYSLILNRNPDIPFTIIKVRERDPNKDAEQLDFASELRSEGML